MIKFLRAPPATQAPNFVGRLTRVQLIEHQAGELSKVVDTYARALLATELEDRVTALEGERK